MSIVKLSSGPRLFHKFGLGSSTAEADYEVTDRAFEYLFHELEVGEDVTLGDIVLLVDKDPILKAVFAQYFSRELCDEAAKGSIIKDSQRDESVEFLELYQLWRYDSFLKEHSGSCSFNLQGVGYAMDEDATPPAWPSGRKGERVKWGMSLTNIREMLHLPVRVNPSVNVVESDIWSKTYMETINSLVSPKITLSALIGGIFWEMSWHGCPEDSLVAANDLKERVNRLREDPSIKETMAFEDVFEALGFQPRKKVFEKFFEIVEGFDVNVIDDAIQDLENNELSGGGLDLRLKAGPRLKHDYRNLTGRILRKEIGESRRHEIPKNKKKQDGV